MATFGWQTHINEEPFKTTPSSRKGRVAPTDTPRTAVSATGSTTRAPTSTRGAVPRSIPAPQDISSKRRIPAPAHHSIASAIASTSNPPSSAGYVPTSAHGRSARSRLSQTAISRLPINGQSPAEQLGDHHLRRRDRTINAYATSPIGLPSRTPATIGHAQSSGTSAPPRTDTSKPERIPIAAASTRATSSVTSRLRSKSNPKPQQQVDRFDAYALPSAVPQKLDTSDLPPPMPTFSANSNSSRSTRLSGSSGLYSGTSTPTSMSSASPQLSLPPSRNAARAPSPVKRFVPPVSRSRSNSATKPNSLQPSIGHGLQVLRESSNSSSSGSTVKGADKSQEIGSAVTSPAVASQARLASPGTDDDSAVTNSSQSSSLPLKVEPLRTNFSRPTPHPTPSPSLDSRPIPQLPPTRPRRTSDAVLEAPIRPIIRTNIPTSITRNPTHRRKSSNTTAASTSTTSLGPTSTAPSIPPSIKSIPSRLPSRNPSPSPSQASSQVSTRSNTSEIERHKQRVLAEKGPPPAKSSSASLRGLFSKKSSAAAQAVEAKPTKLKKQARGPAAGTGHEAYYRGTLRDRSGSVVSVQGTRQRRSSSSSRPDPAGSRKGSFETTPKSEFTEFMESRQSPVYLRGHAGTEMPQSELALTLTSSAGSDLSSRPGQSISSASAMDFREAANPRRPILTQTQSEASSTGTAVPRTNAWDHTKPSLAARRSQHRSQILDLVPGPIPTPIKTGIPVTSPSLDSRGTGGSSAIPMTGSSYMEWDDEPKKLTKEKKTRKPSKSEKVEKSEKTEKTEKTEKPEKASKGLRSFFSRARHKYGKTPTSADFPDEPSTGSQLAHFPHYALPYTTDELRHDPFEDQLRPSFERADRSYTPQEIPIDEYSAMIDQHEQALSALSRDSHSIIGGARDSNNGTPINAEIIQTDGVVQLSELGLLRKPSRLQPLGRIPQVVSTVGRTAPADSIFARTEVLDIDTADGGHLQVPRGRYNQELSDCSQPDTEFEEDVPDRKGKGIAKSSTRAIRYSRILPSPGPAGFTRKFSSAGCSSNGDPDFIAVPPGPGTPMSEDEVWPEFDGLLSYVAPKTGRSKSSSQDGLRQPPEYPVVADILTKRGSDEDPVERGVLVDQYLNDALRQTHSANATPELHVHRRNQLSIPDDGVSPETHVSFSSFYAGYGERNLLVPDAPALPSPSIYSQPSEFSRPVSTASAIGGKSNRKSTSRASRVVKDGLDSNMSVRLGAMTASKWFTYGKVLFSPALDHINAAPAREEQRILVIDGLGVDDWSFFCAMDCKRAIVYNLNPGTSSPKNPPENYRHVGYMPASGKFPFAGGYFAAVIYRFPALASEAQYRQTISECKRVLQPGGYIEVSLVDLDMTRMGGRTTRALRRLKTRIQARDPQLSLTPLSDGVKQMLRRRGFDNLKSAVLRPPVAGAISVPGSARNSPDEGLSKADAEIARMIPNVCRWWYSRCYERAVSEGRAADEDDEDEDEEVGSIWDDEGLLRECERQETNFCLLVAYAQKPAVNKRRTISV